MLLVLGIHRSGTSVTTRLLECLGAVQSKNLHPPMPNNPKGFFEDLDIERFNEFKFLPRIGIHWHSIGFVDWTNLSAYNRSKFALEALEIVRGNYSAVNSLSVLKEPRIGILLPFWLSVLHHAGYNVKVVCAVRDPASVARSLTARDGFSTTHGGMLYITNWLSILSYIQDLPVAFVQFDEIFADPARVLRTVADKLAIPLPADFESRLHGFSSSFFDSSLRHSSFDRRDLPLEADLPPLAVELYDTLLSAAQAQNIKKTAKFLAAAEKIVAPLKPVFSAFDKVFTELAGSRHAATASQSEFQQLQTALRDAQAAPSEARLLLEEEAMCRGQVAERLTAMDAEKQRLSADLEGAREQNGEIEAQAGALAAEREALSARVSSLEADLKKRLEELAKLAKLQISREDERNALHARVSELQADRDSLACERSTHSSDNSSLVTSNSLLAKECEALAADLSQRFEEIALLGKRLLEVEAEGDRRVSAIQARMDAMAARFTWKLGTPFRFAWDKTRNTALKIYRLPTAWRILRLHRSSGLFNHEWYYAQNPDIKAATARPFLHFAFHGVFEGRSPNPAYSESAYIKNTPSAQSSSLKPLLHYTLKGWKG